MQKIQIDLLIKDGVILTMNPQNDVIRDGAIAVQKGEIIAIGSSREISERYLPDEVIDAHDHIVMPGLIDTHFHTGQQFEKNLISYLARQKLLKDPMWLYALIPFEASLSDEDIHLSALFGYSNMLKVGTTCFADPGGPKPELMAPAIEQTGIRGILARSTLDESHNVPPEMQDDIAGIIEKGKNLYNEFNGKADGRIRTWLGMRQIMVCSRALLLAIRKLADELDTGIHIHLSEQPSEVDFSVMKSGKRPAEYLAEAGFFGSKVLAAHSVFLSERDLDIYEEYDVAVAHCPSPAFGFMGPTRVPEMRRRGLRVGLGSDGALSTGGSLDLFRQMTITRYAQTLHYGLPYYDTQVVRDEDLLRMATIGGAGAIFWDDQIGSLEVGKKADLILIGLDDLDILPCYDPINTAAQVAHGQHVDTVVVNGEIVVRDKRLMKVDEDELVAKVKERSPKIVERFLERAAG
ncbi:MAG: amidohydrolase [Anaerolineaceae bacterium]|nr:amidohydrolase [Anaerolineaceae bacterium]